MLSIHLNLLYGTVFSKISTNDHINKNQLSNTMYSPNSRGAVIVRANARVPNENSSSLHQPRTVYVGKEQYPINLTLLEDVSTHTWKNSREFYQLETAVFFLKSTHQVADIMELVAQEIPIDDYSAAQDATK